MDDCHRSDHIAAMPPVGRGMGRGHWYVRFGRGHLQYGILVFKHGHCHELVLRGKHTLLISSSLIYANGIVAAAHLPAQGYSDQPKVESICSDSPGAGCRVSSKNITTLCRISRWLKYWPLTSFQRSNIATLIRLKYLIDIRYVPSAASSELVRLYLDSFI